MNLLYWDKTYRNKKGFTLIEIIASIALLVLVIGILLPFFPQIMSWTQTADDELVASNLLGQVASDVNNSDKNNSIINYINKNQIKICDSGLNTLSQDSLGDIATYLLNNVEYNVQLKVCKENNVDLNLYRANVIISTTNGKPISESYTYITGDSQ